MDLRRNSRNSDENSTSRDRSTSANRRIPNFDESLKKKYKGSPLPYPSEQTRSDFQARNGVPRKIGFLNFSSSGEEEEFLEEINEPGPSTDHLSFDHLQQMENENEISNQQSTQQSTDYRNQKRALNRGNEEGNRFSIYSFLLGFFVGSFVIGSIFYSHKSCEEAMRENLQIYWRNLKAHPEIRYINECWENFGYRSWQNAEEKDKEIEIFQKTEEIGSEIGSEIEKIEKIEKIESKSTPELEKLMNSEIVDRWMEGGSEDPTVIAVVGSEEKSRDLIRNILASILDNENVEEKLLEATNQVNRVDLYEWFYKTLTNGGVRVSAVIGIEKLRWDSPLSLHAWTDDGQPMKSPPPIANSLILLGVSVDGEEDGYEKVENEEIKCQAFLQKYLLKKWSLSGGTYSMISPIVNSRIDYAFCVPL